MLRRLSFKSDSNQRKPKGNYEKLLADFLEFIASPIWSIPISTFIEQQSVVFDRQQMVTDVYENIHKEYRKLIDTLIECFCDDVQKSTQDLTEAIKLLKDYQLDVKQRLSLEPLAAAQDYNVFVPMMMRRNVELQLQALQMIEIMCGLIPAVLQLEDGETLKNKKKLSPEDTERYVLISVLRQSKEEFDMIQKNQLHLQLREDYNHEGIQERNRLEMEIKNENDLMRKALAENSVATNSQNNQSSSSTVETPLTVATVFISQILNNSANQNSSSNINNTPSKSNKQTDNQQGEEAQIKSNISKSSSRAKSATRKISDNEKPKIEKSQEEDSQSDNSKQNKNSDDKSKTRRYSMIETENKSQPDRRASVDKIHQKTKEKPPKSATKRTDDKPPRNLGDVKGPRFPSNPKNTERAPSPGMEHGPRKKNLDDVNKHLVDAKRINSSDIRARAEYLKEQRDKLLQMKQLERMKQMNGMIGTTERPKTAKAAKDIMDNNNGNNDIKKEINEKIKTEILTID